jgi:hypothetical protein
LLQGNDIGQTIKIVIYMIAHARRTHNIGTRWLARRRKHPFIYR